MITEEELEQLGQEFANASEAILAKSFERDFVDVAEDYRRLEAEYVARMGDHEFGVLETKRRIAEDILSAAHSKHPPFEVCREVWNELVHLGFSNTFRECLMSGFYADCCAYDEQPEEGLAVLEPLLAKLQRRLDEAKAVQKPTRFYEQELGKLHDLQGALLAQQRGQLGPERSTRRLDEAHPPPTAEEERSDALGELRDKLEAQRNGGAPTT
ncbi:hypothetical protein [Polyangium mundeleinium]|uniref:Uncharacterized protein n=1 Tax=Polyangium mundeleinium TaxID=2995306 RepID=A0ABT5F757_9BACT|nr:hypothetical protein [Polyangium mundeleinium]MDC0748962.1 hypothetical protein [Polyangium mundeleinium]